MTILKDLCVARPYKTRNGEEKKQWVKIGAVHASKSGREYITLDAHISLAGLPRAVDGDDRIYVSMFDPRQTERKPDASLDLPDTDAPF